MHIKRIGGPVKHRGKRVPSMMSVPSIEIGVRPFARPLYEHIRDQVAAGYSGAQYARSQASARLGLGCHVPSGGVGGNVGIG